MAGEWTGFKLGEGMLYRQYDLGWRELGGFWFPDSNIAQNQYPIHRPTGPPMQAEGRSTVDKYGDDFDKRMGRDNDGRDDLSRDDRDRDRE